MVISAGSASLIPCGEQNRRRIRKITINEEVKVQKHDSGKRRKSVHCSPDVHPSHRPPAQSRRLELKHIHELGARQRATSRTATRTAV